MSYDKLTFWLFLQKHCDPSIDTFKNVFGSNIDLLPDHVTSSRKIRNLLNIDTIQKEFLFRKVWMEYFKTKLNEL